MVHFLIATRFFLLSDQKQRSGWQRQSCHRTCSNYLLVSERAGAGCVLGLLILNQIVVLWQLSGLQTCNLVCRHVRLHA